MQEEKGFTLIEIMVAITILAFGILALATMQIAAIHGNSSAKEMTEASTIAQNKLDELISLPFDDVQLDDTNGNGLAGLDSPTVNEVIAAGPALIPTGGSGPDYAQQISPDGTRNYFLYWNVRPGFNLKTISVIVAWEEHGMHRLNFSYIKNI